MKLQKAQSRFSRIKIIAIAAAVILAGYLGYVIYTNHKAATTETISTQVEDVEPAPIIDKANDLNEAEATIEDIEVESGNIDDMTEIEKDLSAF